MRKTARYLSLFAASALIIPACASEPEIITLEVDFVLPQDQDFLNSIDTYRARVYYSGGEKDGILYEGEYSRNSNDPTILNDLLPTAENEHLTILVEGVSASSEGTQGEAIVSTARSGPIVLPGTDRVELFLGHKSAFNLLPDPLPHPLTGHAAAGNQLGTILLAGGLDDNDAVNAETWIFDDGFLSHTFGNVTAGPEMKAPRVHHSVHSLTLPATNQTNGDAWIAILGGESVDRMSYISTPSGTFVPWLDLSTTFLPLSSTEVLSPQNLTLEDGPPLLDRRAFHTSLVLNSEKVLLCGGLLGNLEGEEATIQVAYSCEMWSPESDTASGFSLYENRIFHAMTALPDGRILLTGGVKDLTIAPDNLLGQCEWFDPSDPVPAIVGNLSRPRAGHNGIMIPGTDGKVLISGGYIGLGSNGGDTIDVTETTEIFDSASAHDRPFTAGPEMICPRVFHDAIPLTDGKALIFGGHGRDPRSRPPPEVFDYYDGTFRLLNEADKGCGEVESSDTNALASTSGGAMARAVMSDGSILITGGSWSPGGSPLESADRAVVYVP